MRQIYFMHVPKSGGTSIREMLEGQFEQTDVFPSREMIAREPTCYHNFRAFKDLWNRNGGRHYALVAGHVPYWRIRGLLDDDCLTITYMREPLARAISEIIHHQSANPRWRDVPINDIIRNNEAVFRKSFGVGSYFGRTPEAASKALSRFDLVGLQSRFEQSLEMLNHLTGLELEARHSNVGSRSEQGDDQLAISALYELQDKLADDAKFYTEACASFHRGRMRMRKQLGGRT